MERLDPPVRWFHVAKTDPRYFLSLRSRNCWQIGNYPDSVTSIRSRGFRFLDRLLEGLSLAIDRRCPCIESGSIACGSTVGRPMGRTLTRCRCCVDCRGRSKPIERTLSRNAHCVGTRAIARARRCIGWNQRGCSNLFAKDDFGRSGSPRVDRKSVV